jgi:glycerol-3-phosphate dehydrogenase
VVAALGAPAATTGSPRATAAGLGNVDVTHHPVGNALKRPFGTAFEYSDCVVDDSRLVILNAVDAAERGAVIRTGARCVRADRSTPGGW